MENFRLLDVGNTTAAFYYKGRLKKIKVVKFKNIFLNKKFYYINVNHNLKKTLKKIKNGFDLQKRVKLKTKYKILGIDRAVVSKAIKNGIVVDAGSAITVDVIKNRFHKGGFILPGIHSLLTSYENISKALIFDLDFNTNLNKLPNTTKEALNYALIKSIILPIKEISKNQRIYFTGGDGEVLSKFFKNSIYDEYLIFKGMKTIIKEKNAYYSTSKR